jgi:hypothetical protein
MVPWPATFWATTSALAADWLALALADTLGDEEEAGAAVCPPHDPSNTAEVSTIRKSRTERISKRYVRRLQAQTV